MVGVVGADDLDLVGYRPRRAESVLVNLAAHARSEGDDCKDTVATQEHGLGPINERCCLWLREVYGRRSGGVVWLAVVCIPLDQIQIEETTGSAFGVDFHKHVCIWVVSSCGHSIVLRPVGVSVVSPLVNVVAHLLTLHWEAYTASAFPPRRLSA